MRDGNMPSGGVRSYIITEDGDRIINSVTYPTVTGKTKQVKFERGIDGDMIPETGFTLDGDYHWPGERYEL